MKSHDQTGPPEWADRFLLWYCHENLVDEIQGDLYEQFQKNLKSKGIRTARAKFILDVFRFFRPTSFKKTRLGMNTQILVNYLKVAFRVFRKEKGYTFANTLGLALGITCSLFIYLWVQDEFQYNQWPKDVERIQYVLVNQIESSGNIDTWETTPYPLQAVLQEKYPSIEKAAIMNWGAELIVERTPGDPISFWGRFSTPEVFEVFSIPFIQGSFEALKTNKETVVFSEKSAIRFFGEDWKSKDVIGKVIIDKDGDQFTLVGVFEDIPSHSTLTFDFIIPFEFLLKSQPWHTHWGNYNNHLYVKINENYTTESANENVKNVIKENREMEGEVPVLLQPFQDRHLYRTFENGKVAGGRIEYVRLLSFSAILILILAAVNFMNLTTARSAKRSKETGIRKVMGAFRSSLRTQFILEAILMTFLAFVVSALLVGLLLPYFNVLAGKSIGWAFFSVQFVATCIGFILIIGILSGLYPAIYMASLNPVASIKGVIRASVSGIFFRRSLVVFQFVITIAMIVGAATIYSQLQYIFTKNTGLDRENVIKTGVYDMTPEEFKIYRERLLNMPGIQSITTGDNDPTRIGSTTGDPKWEGKPKDMEAYFKIMGTDPEFIPMMGIEVLAGRNFSSEIKSDSVNYVINEATAALMGFEDPVGQDLEFWGNKGKVIGVVKNFHIASMYEPFAPLIMRLDDEPWLMLVKTKPGQSKEAIESLETLHKEYNPARVFNFSFLDDDYKNAYQAEQLVSKLTLYFTIVAIVISCLGMLSLVAYTTELKTKEIGIRKVLGASIGRILIMIGKEFVILVVLAFLIATPLAYALMDQWLAKFAFRIGLSSHLFLLAGVGALVITVVTISHQAIRTATRNPVDSLRDE